MKKLIIDTDVALGVWHDGRPRDIDDGFAMVEAINSDQIDLLGVTCVYGNGPLDEVYRVAQEIVALKQSSVPVTPGAAGPLSNTHDIPVAVTFLAEQLRRHSTSIAAIGPLTNIALLVQHYPDVLANIEQLILVAGRTPGREFFIGEAGPVGDFNFENDAQATEIVMSAGIPCVLMGFELTSQVEVTEVDLETIKQQNNPTAGYFYDNSMAWLNYWTQTFSDDAGFHPWDSAAIAWLLNPDWFAQELRGHKISNDPKQLNCSTTYPGPKHTYCHGFTPGGAQAFVQSVISEVY